MTAHRASTVRLRAVGHSDVSEGAVTAMAPRSYVSRPSATT
jgi:hypothetical protein